MRRRLAPLDPAFGSGATFLFVAAMAVAVGSLVFQATFARSFDITEIAALDAVLGLALLAGIPIGAAQVVVVRHAARSRAVGAWSGEMARLAVVGTALGGVLAGFVLSRPGGFGRGGLLVALFVVAYVGLSAAMVVPRGVLLVRGEFEQIGYAGLVGIGVRLALAVVVLWLGWGVPAAAGVLVLSTVVSFALLVWRAMASLAVRGQPPLVIPWGSFIRPVLAFCGLALLVVVEAVLAQRYLHVGALNEMQTATDLARTAVLIPQAMVLVALACFARGGEAAFDGLKLALRVVAVIALVVTALLTMGANIGSEHLLGRPDAVPPGLVLLVGAASSMVGLMYVLVSYEIMRGRSNVATVWGALGLTIAAAVLSHTSTATLAIAFLLIVLAALARLLAGPALVGPAAVWSGEERRRRDSPSDGLDLTIVVPFYNPGGDKLRSNLLELVAALDAEGERFEIVAVSDGSTDGSEQLVADLCSAGVRTVVLERNRGKGAALRAGLETARGRYLGFIDADGDIPPAQLHHFLGLMRMYEADMVVGSKRHPLSQVHYPPLRRVYSKAYQSLVHGLFRIDVADTQTGIKLFRRDVLADVLPLVVERGFVFDLELLVVARHRGWRRVLEAPVTVEHQFTSTISIHTVRRMLIETLALAVRLHLLRSYDAPDVSLDSAGLEALTRSHA